MHIPMFNNNVDEEDGYFNIPICHRLKMLEDFEKAGVKAVFGGHYHRCAGGIWNSPNGNKVCKFDKFIFELCCKVFCTPNKIKIIYVE